MVSKIYRSRLVANDKQRLERWRDLLRQAHERHDWNTVDAINELIPEIEARIASFERWRKNPDGPQAG